MSIPKEPRGLMIQLMYLVLTAMLALNITKEVLDAFSTINTSIENSNEGIKEKNDRTLKAFEHIADRNPDLAKKRDELYPKAQQIKAESDKLVQYLEDWKQQIVTKGGGWVTENGVEKVKTMDDIDIPTRMFVEEKNGDKVKAEMEAYVNKIVALTGEANPDALKKQLPLQFLPMKKTEMNRQGDWSYGTFHNIPVIAAITLFSKWQNDVRMSESVTIENLMSRVGEDEFIEEIKKVDGFMAVAVPSTSYALAGDEITANIAMAAYDKTVQPRVSSNVGAVSVKDGVGTLKFRASGTGVQTVRGTITLPTKGNKVETQNWEFKYTVGTAGASLQLDKMNVMYIGLENPVTLSASGYNVEDVSWDMPGAKINKVGPGKYTVEVSTPNVQGVDYTISARSKTGQTVKVGGGKMRIRTVPDPIVKFAGKAGAMTLPANQAKAQLGLIAELENFIYDYKFTVTSFKFVTIAKGDDEEKSYDVKGASFSSIKNMMAASRAGDTWYFESIKVKGQNSSTERNIAGAIIVKLR